MMLVLVTDGAVSRAKLHSNHHHQQTNTQLFTGRMPFLSPNQQCQGIVLYRSVYCVYRLRSSVIRLLVSIVNYDASGWEWTMHL